MANDQSRHIAKIKSIVDKLALRLRLQRAIEFGISAAVFGVMLLVLALVLYKTQWMDVQALQKSAVALGGGVLLFAIIGAIQRLDPIALAQRIDRSHNLHDRISSALSFANEGENNDFTQAQLKDAEQYVDQVELKRAAPFKRPKDLMPMAIAMVGLVLVGAIKAPDHQHDLPTPPVFEKEQILDSATIELEKDKIEEMKKALEGVQDPETKIVLEELDELLKDVEDKKVTEKEFFDRLKKLEEKLAKKKNDEALEALTEKLKQAAEELEKEEGKSLKNNKELKELVDALKNKDLKKSSEALNKLAEQLLKKDKLSDKDLKNMAKLLEKFADKIDPNDPKLQKLAKKHEDTIKKLMDKLGKKGKLSKKDKNRLEKAQKALNKLKGQMKAGDNNKAKRQLKQLQRQTRDMAKQLNKAGQKTRGNKKQRAQQQAQKQAARQQAAKNAKDASKGMKQGAKKQAQQGARQQAKKQIDNMRESMRRSGKSGGKQNAQRQKKIKDFLRRAGKKDGQQGKGAQKGGKNGKQGPKSLSRGKDGKDGKNGKGGKGQGKNGQQGKNDQQGKNGQGQGQKPGQGKNAKQTDKAGKGAGDRTLGEETKLNSKRVDENLKGTKGKGPTRSEIIRSASEKGFATRRYKKVYGDYSSVIEEVMEKGKVPKGYRFYVKRYFQLIKPREQK